MTLLNTVSLLQQYQGPCGEKSPNYGSILSVGQVKETRCLCLQAPVWWIVNRKNGRDLTILRECQILTPPCAGGRQLRAAVPDCPPPGGGNRTATGGSRARPAARPSGPACGG